MIDREDAISGFFARYNQKVFVLRPDRYIAGVISTASEAQFAAGYEEACRNISSKRWQSCASTGPHACHQSWEKQMICLQTDALATLIERVLPEGSPGVWPHDEYTLNSWGRVGIRS